MSPTEFELRAALREGEGDGPDADIVINRAVEYRRQRRARRGSGLAAAAIVAGIAVGGGFLIGSSGTGDEASSSAGGAGSRAADTASPSSATAGGGAATTAPRNNSYASPASVCPSTVPHLMVPGGGGTGQFGGNGRLMPDDVTHVTVCAYGTIDAPSAPTVVSFTGPAALELARSLNASLPVRQGACPDFATMNTRQYVVIATSSDGQQGDPVVVTLADNQCQSQATNGTAVRYGWQPPSSVASAFPSVPATRVPAPRHS